MLRGILVASAVLVLLSAGLVSASPAPSAPVSWSATPVVRNVSLGDPIQIIVKGPANGSFFVSAEAEPFNHTYPLFNSTYGLPAGPLDEAKSVLVTIPTTDFSYGPYLIAVVNATELFTVAYIPFLVVNPLNATTVNGDLSFIWAELNYTQAREISLRDQNYALQGQVEEYFWISIGEFILLVAVVVVTKTGVSNTRFGKAIRRFIRGLVYGDMNSDPWKAGGNPSEIINPPMDPTRSYTSDLYPTCDACTTLTTEGDKVLHLRQDHGIPNPRSPRDYYRFLPAVRAAVERRPDPQPRIAAVRQALRDIPDSAFAGLPR